ncbi:MAG: C39 family peptidase [Pirellulales bacterium]|nr:C39 family peptidase [Pirellulales bacterium]
MRGELEAIQDLYDRGQFSRAFELSEKLGPLRQWRGTTARVLAGRLANALGGPRLASALHDRARREAPDDPTAQFYGWLALWGRSGPFAALRGHLARGRPPRGPRKIEAYWYAAVGHLYALFRDFERAAQHLGVAESLAPESPWVCVDRATLLERQDRREEAVVVARRALELRDWYSPAIVCLARLYGDLNRHAEAQTLLQAATQHNDSGAIWAHLALLQVHARQGGAARESVARAKAAYRLCEEEVAKQLAAVDSDAAYVSGDRAAAIELARVSESPFYVALADRLQQAPASARCVRLAVPFVRQHDVTCVPATLTMLCRYWGLEVDHLEVAKEICFSGTPHHVKRRWATSQGLIVRDFTLTWEAVVALVDAGFPFALATVEADSSHVQAIVGYDEARRTLLVHDPGQATETEMAFDQLLERYAAHGPEASVFVPVSEAERLATIALVDIELHDQMHELRAALDEHRRADAGACVAQLTALAPEHRLTWIAQYYLARYDGQLAESLALVDRLLERYPRDGQLLLFRYALLTEIRPRGERLAWLAEVCARAESDPALWQRYGSELRREARTYAEADRWLRQAIRRRSAYPPAWHALAGLRWSQGRRAEATEFYRIGTCLEPTSQYLVDSYFKACRYTGEVDRAMALLRERFERDGHRSEMPGCALFEALEAVGRVSEGLEVLDRAVAQRADDGELLLYAAQARLRVGDVGAVEALLERAAGRCRQTAWLAARAELVECRGTSHQMLAAWREVSVRDESHQDARSAIARLLALGSTRRAPLAYLDRLARLRPEDYAFACLHAEWLQRLAPQRHCSARSVRRRALWVCGRRPLAGRTPRRSAALHSARHRSAAELLLGLAPPGRLVHDARPARAGDRLCASPGAATPPRGRSLADARRTAFNSRPRRGGARSGRRRDPAQPALGKFARHPGAAVGRGRSLGRGAGRLPGGGLGRAAPCQSSWPHRLDPRASGGPTPGHRGDARGRGRRARVLLGLEPPGRMVLRQRGARAIFGSRAEAGRA